MPSRVVLERTVAAANMVQSDKTLCLFINTLQFREKTYALLLAWKRLDKASHIYYLFNRLNMIEVIEQNGEAYELCKSCELCHIVCLWYI